MFTKTQIEIMKVFVSKINEKFSIKQISETIKKAYPLVHRSIKSLIEEGLLIRDNKELLSLNYRGNSQYIAYIESLRADKFLKNKVISLFTKDALDRINLDFFVFLVFGSSVESKEPKDIDILLIVQEKERINEVERIVSNIASNFSKKFDINVISVESAYEMLNKRDSINILNETLNKHILLFGAENYYRILKNARQ
jgi:predicted transcriptional regulator/predicted nucleotidyltransferase